MPLQVGMEEDQDQSLSVLADFSNACTAYEKINLITILWNIVLCRITEKNKTDAYINFVIFSQYLICKSSHCEYFSQGQTACHRKSVIIIKFGIVRLQ
jgi:hypothetical protein